MANLKIWLIICLVAYGVVLVQGRLGYYAQRSFKVFTNVERPEQIPVWNTECITCKVPGMYEAFNCRCILRCNNTEYRDDLGGCVAVSSRCLVNFAATNWCKTCKRGYQLKQNGMCLPTRDHCSNWNADEGVCIRCEKGYLLTDQKCESPCAEQEFLLDDICTPVPEKCDQWGLLEGCISCKQPQLNEVYQRICLKKCEYREYRQSSGSCAEVSHRCLEWSVATGQCTSCKRGYQLKQNRKCLPSRDHCLDWNIDKGICDRCLDGYLLTDQKCESPCTEQEFLVNNVCTPASNDCYQWQLLKGCISCKDNSRFEVVDGRCIGRCITRFYRQNGTCVPVSDKCLSWIQGTGNCTSCKSEYILYEHQCVQPISSCVTYNAELNACVKCKHGYYVSNDKCLSYCGHSMFYVNGKCIYATEGCSRWTQTEGCTACTTPQTFEVYDGFCVPKCLETEYRSNGTCVPVSDQCLDWRISTNSCASCKYGYEMDSNGNCLQVTEHCIDWIAEQGTCKACEEGYSLVKGQQCMQQLCNDREILDKGICTPVPAECDSYSVVKGCTSCSSTDYYISSGRCIRKCQLWEYRNESNQCTKVGNGCETWFTYSGECTGCKRGYLLANDKCLLDT